MINFDKNEFLKPQIYSTLDEYETRCNVNKEIIEEIEQLQQENKQLKEQLLVTQTNEETFRLEMKDITQTLGLDEDTIFDDVKIYARSLKDNWNKLKEYANKMHKYFLYTDVNEIYKQSMKEDNPFPNLFNLSELNASDRVLNSICKKIQELEQGSDSNE